MMQGRQETAPQQPPTRTATVNQDILNFIALLVLRAVLPPLLLVAAVAFVTMPYTLGHHPGEAGAVQQIFARHMT
jgi:hypothetical protein